MKSYQRAFMPKIYLFSKDIITSPAKKEGNNILVYIKLFQLVG